MMNRRRFLAAAGAVLAAMAAGCSRLLPGKSNTNMSPGAVEPTPLAGGGAPLAAAPAEAAAPVDVKPFRIGLLSDVHLQPEERFVSEKLAKAVRELQEAGAQFWVVNGDVADHGRAEEHAELKRVMGDLARPETLLVNVGNHEFYDMKTTDDVSIRRFTEAFGLAKPYSNRVVGGIHMVMLSQEMWKTAPYNNDWCWMTQEQVDWFGKVLAEHRDKFTCVFMHQPLNDTVTGSLGPKAFGSTNMADQVYALLKENPQVRLWFSGHTHRRLDAAGQVVTKEHTTFVALGSTIYLLGPGKGSGGYGRDWDANQTRLMEVYPDKVVLRARDHQAGKWMTDLELTIDRGDFV